MAHITALDLMAGMWYYYKWRTVLGNMASIQYAPTVLPIGNMGVMALCVMAGPNGFGAAS
jgi:hypothetical protein